MNCSGGDPPFLGGYGLGFYCLAEFCLVWIRSLHVCVVGFIIMGNRRTTHPEGSNCDTMTPPVHSHRPQTHTFFQTLNPRCCCSNGLCQCWTGCVCSSSEGLYACDNQSVESLLSPTVFQPWKTWPNETAQETSNSFGSLGRVRECYVLNTCPDEVQNDKDGVSGGEIRGKGGVGDGG